MNVMFFFSLLLNYTDTHTDIYVILYKWATNRKESNTFLFQTMMIKSKTNIIHRFGSEFSDISI